MEQELHKPRLIGGICWPQIKRHRGFINAFRVFQNVNAKFAINSWNVLTVLYLAEQC